MESAEGRDRLGSFFASLESCRDKSPHTHGLHPYPAKFIPHIPRELIAALSRPGDLVWDPMCGSGTTLVEARLAGRDAVGGDINPVAVLASRVKTALPDREAVDALKGLALRLAVEARVHPQGRPGDDPDPPEFPNREHWFEPIALRELSLIQQAVERLSSHDARNIGRCALSAIVVAVSNQESETRWRARPRRLEPGAVLLRFVSKLRSMLAAVDSNARLATGTGTVERRDVRTVPSLPRPADLIVTSPPYANAHDYYLYNKLRMFWLGEDFRVVRESEFGSRNRHSERGRGIEDYLEAMRDGLAAMRDGLAPGGRLAMVVADGVIAGESYAMDRLIPELAEGEGFGLERSYRFDHRRFNTGQHNGFAGLSGARKWTHVLILR